MRLYDRYQVLLAHCIPYTARHAFAQELLCCTRRDKPPLFRFGETLDINLAQLDEEIGFIPMLKRKTWRWVQIIWSSRMHG